MRGKIVDCIECTTPSVTPNTDDKKGEAPQKKELSPFEKLLKEKGL